MKPQPNKKASLKLTIDRKSLNHLTKCHSELPPSSKCSQKTLSSNGKTSSSSKIAAFQFQDSYSTPNPSIVNSEGQDFQNSLLPSTEDKSQLIQYLIQENLHLQKQNSDKDSIISGLIQSSAKKPIIIQRANTSNTERSFEPFQLKASTKKLHQNQIQSIHKEQEHKQQQYLSSILFNRCSPDNSKNLSPLGFTFQCTEVKSQQGIRTLNKRLPKEFQIVPSKKRYFI